MATVSFRLDLHPLLITLTVCSFVGGGQTCFSFYVCCYSRCITSVLLTKRSGSKEILMEKKKVSRKYLIIDIRLKTWLPVCSRLVYAKLPSEY